MDKSGSIEQTHQKLAWYLRHADCCGGQTRTIGEQYQTEHQMVECDRQYALLLTAVYQTVVAESMSPTQADERLREMDHISALLRNRVIDGMAALRWDHWEQDHRGHRHSATFIARLDCDHTRGLIENARRCTSAACVIADPSATTGQGNGW